MFNINTYNKECEERFDEELPKLIKDLVWVVTDGGCKTTERDYLTYQDEPIREFEELKKYLISYNTTLLKSFLEGECERLQNDIDFFRESLGVGAMSDRSKGVIEEKAYQITHYKSLLETLK